MLSPSTGKKLSQLALMLVLSAFIVLCYFREEVSMCLVFQHNHNIMYRPTSLYSLWSLRCILYLIWTFLYNAGTATSVVSALCRLFPAASYIKYLSDFSDDPSLTEWLTARACTGYALWRYGNIVDKADKGLDALRLVLFLLVLAAMVQIVKLGFCAKQKPQSYGPSGRLEALIIQSSKDQTARIDALLEQLATLKAALPEPDMGSIPESLKLAITEQLSAHHATLLAALASVCTEISSLVTGIKAAGTEASNKLAREIFQLKPTLLSALSDQGHSIGQSLDMRFRTQAIDIKTNCLDAILPMLKQLEAMMQSSEAVIDKIRDRAALAPAVLPGPVAESAAPSASSAVEHHKGDGDGGSRNDSGDPSDAVGPSEEAGKKKRGGKKHKSAAKKKEEEKEDNTSR